MNHFLESTVLRCSFLFYNNHNRGISANNTDFSLAALSRQVRLQRHGQCKFTRTSRISTQFHPIHTPGSRFGGCHFSNSSRPCFGSCEFDTVV